MKTIIVTVALLLSVQAIPTPSPEEIERIMGILNACITEEGADANFGDRVMKHDFSGLSHNEQCVLKCILVKEGTMKEDGSYNMDVINEKMAGLEMSDELKTKSKECLNVKGADACEAAMLAAQCSLKLHGSMA